MTGRLSIELLTTEAEFKYMVRTAMVAKLNELLRRGLPQLRAKISPFIHNALIKSPVYRDILVGDLSADLGFRRGQEERFITGIIKALSNEFILELKPLTLMASGDISGGVELKIIQSDFKDILNHPLAFIKTKKQKLHWLDWLLTWGDRIVVRDHSIIFKRTRHSRSGFAIMVKSKFSPFWRVPPQFSGTLDNNWITRALEGANVEAEITNLFYEYLKKAVT
jgi:hypothetical protein